MRHHQHLPHVFPHIFSKYVYFPYNCAAGHVRDQARENSGAPAGPNRNNECEFFRSHQLAYILSFQRMDYDNDTRIHRTTENEGKGTRGGVFT